MRTRNGSASSGIAVRPVRSTRLVVLLISYALSAIAGCNLNMGVEPPPDVGQPAPADDGQSSPPGAAPGSDLPPLDGGDEPIPVDTDPEEQFLSDDLAAFASAANGGDAVDLRALTVGSQVVFSIPAGVFAHAANAIAAFEADHWTLNDRSPIVLYRARGTREPFVGSCAHEYFCSVRVVQTDGKERLECTCEHALRGTSNELG